MKAEWTNADNLTPSETTGKAILVIDVQMTEDGKHICNSCPVWDEKICGCKHDFMTGHKGCPLKPMPKKNDFKFGNISHDRFVDGWNTCIEVLEK